MSAEKPKDDPVPVTPENLAKPVPYPGDVVPPGFARVGGYSNSLAIDPTYFGPGDCVHCGCVQLVGCDGNGTLAVGKSGFRQCPAYGVKLLRDEKEPRPEPSVEPLLHVKSATREGLAECGAPLGARYLDAQLPVIDPEKLLDFLLHSVTCPACAVFALKLTKELLAQVAGFKAK